MTIDLHELGYFGDPAELVDALDVAAAEFSRRITALRPGWMRNASCRGVDQSIFFPTRGESAELARSICSTCPVVDSCMTWSLAQPDDHGIAAGLSGRQRRQLRAERKRSAA